MLIRTRTNRRHLPLTTATGALTAAKTEVTCPPRSCKEKQRKTTYYVNSQIKKTNNIIAQATVTKCLTRATPTAASFATRKRWCKHIPFINKHLNKKIEESDL